MCLLDRYDSEAPGATLETHDHRIYVRTRTHTDIDSIGYRGVVSMEVS